MKTVGSYSFTPTAKTDTCPTSSTSIASVPTVKTPTSLASSTSSTWIASVPTVIFLTCCV